MNLRHDKYADRYREAYPRALLADNVTVAELVQYLSSLPPSMIVHSWDCYNDSRSAEIDVNPDFEENIVTIIG